MRSLEQIQVEAKQYARQAAQQEKAPCQLWWQDVGGTTESFGRMCRQVPFLGDYVHPDWQPFDTNTLGLWKPRKGQVPALFGATYSYAWFFVDSSGFGGDNEPALSATELQRALRFLLLNHDASFGIGIREAGQFQVHIGLYVRKEAQWDGQRFVVKGLNAAASQPYGTRYREKHD